MPNKPNLEVEVISKEEHDALMAEFRKENKRLQVMIAKNRVAYESEINRLIAEHAEEVNRSPTLNLVLTTAPTNAPADVK